MNIETDNELNFLPEKVEWGVNQSLKECIYALITFFLIGAGTLLVGFILLKGMSLASRGDEQHQPQEIQQQVTNNEKIAQSVSIPESIPDPELKSELQTLLKILNLSLPEHLRSGYNASPMDVYDSPGGTVVYIFPSGTPFIYTQDTYGASWRWVVTFGGYQGFASFFPGGVMEN